MTGSEIQCDVLVIGAGMAGASVAAELATHLNVTLIEREPQPGYHTTGRSAALFTKAYGPPVIRALSRASEGFMRGRDRAPQSFVSPRGALFIGRADQAEQIAREQDELGDAVTAISPDAIRAMVPSLRDAFTAHGLYDASAADIDVHALHQHYLRQLRAAGGALLLRAEILSLTQPNGPAGDWLAETSAGRACAPIVVNAAGAWADMIGDMAGATPLGLTPKRRTALLVAPPDGAATQDWPLIVGIDEDFYVKPDAGKLLLSPADETPSAPCDAQPEEIDIAICVDRIETAFDLSVRRIEHKWAGLRSFLPDGSPAAGYDPVKTGFFWLAGQGGYGIQSAPALARTAAALIRHKAIPDDIAAQGVTEAALSPARDGMGASQP